MTAQARIACRMMATSEPKLFESLKSFVKLSMNGTAMLLMNAMTQILMARLNIAPIAFSVRNANFSVTPKARSGMVSSAMV